MEWYAVISTIDIIVSCDLVQSQHILSAAGATIASLITNGNLM